MTGGWIRTEERRNPSRTRRPITGASEGARHRTGAPPAFGANAVQLDGYTTYEGGTGVFSTSDGIDAATEAGGDLIGARARNGADADVRRYVLAARRRSVRVPGSRP